MERLRKPFEGVRNIVFFNWHFYLVFLFVFIFLFFAWFRTSGLLHCLLGISLILSLSVFMSTLVVSIYVYDLSGFYTLNWLDAFFLPKDGQFVNIHSGFDETSQSIQIKFPAAHLSVYDFYDPQKHTELSIGRARKSRPPYGGTVGIKSHLLPVSSGSVDAVFLIFSAHEIRDNKERVLFFREVRRVLKPEGRVVLVEHVRDLSNFLAYTLGAFHFHSWSTWLHTIRASDFHISQQRYFTPFVRALTLKKNVSSS